MWACNIYLSAGKSAKSPTQTPKEKKEKKKKREFKMNVCVVNIFVQFGWR